MGISLLKRPVYYQQVKTEPECSCDEYCDVNELEFMRKVNNFTCTYYNLKKNNMDLIRVSKSKAKEILKYYNENIVSNKPKPVCCGDYCNKDELAFFKLINQHYKTYYGLTNEEKDKILEGAEKLKDIYNYLKDKYDIKLCSITALSKIRQLIRKTNLKENVYDDKFNNNLSLMVMVLGFSFDKKEDKHNNSNSTDTNNTNNVEYNGKMYSINCD